MRVQKPRKEKAITTKDAKDHKGKHTSDAQDYGSERGTTLTTAGGRPALLHLPEPVA